MSSLRSLAIVSSCALAVGLVGVAVELSSPHGAEGLTPGASVEVVIDIVDRVDSTGVANTIAGLLADQNSTAFDVDASIVESADGPDLELAAYVAGKDAEPDTDPVPEVEADATAAIEAEGDGYQAEGTAVEVSGIEVTEVQLEVNGSASSPVDAATDRVTMLIETVRSMEGLPDWEESTYYVANVDIASGSVLNLEVHDEFWYQQHPQDVVADISQVPLPPSEVRAQPALLTSSQKAKAVAYANKYWNSYNSAYLASPNDCTSFISQALYAGGWLKKGTDPTGANRAKKTVWWYTGTGIYPKSHSWADAEVWRKFAQGQGRVASIITKRARSGDIIQYDIGLNGMNHTAIVTFYDTSTSQPLLTYHTANTHNKPLSAFQADVATGASAQDYRLYAWRT